MKNVIFVIFITAVFFLSGFIASLLEPIDCYVMIGLTFGVFFGSSITLYLAKTTDLLE